MMRTRILGVVSVFAVWLTFWSAGVLLGVETPVETAKVTRFPGLGDPGALVELVVEAPGRGLLRGQDARQQVLVTGKFATGQLRDLTRDVRFSTEPPGLARVDETGVVFPMVNGKTRVTASIAGPDGEISNGGELEVRDVDRVVPVNFPNQIVPIFTKHGCNGGGCHGKSGGQNGFKLSLLGFYPREDHEYLAKESRGRRVFVSAPDRSLLLAKAANEIAHGGGFRFATDSPEYGLIRRWIAQGMPYGNEQDLRVTRIEVFPERRVMPLEGSQQLSVLAHYSDGSSEDVTRMAQFDSNQTDLAEVSEPGLVRTIGSTGEAAIMVRYQSQVAVFRATIPLGIKIEKLPAARNFIDELVFDKLKALGIPPSPVCDDSTFLRRVMIDIAGRVPTAQEARDFGADQDSAKRDKVIDRLLASTEYAENFARKWSAVLRNRGRGGGDKRGAYSFYDWIRQSMHHNLPYDQFVTQIIAASGDIQQHPPVAWYRSVTQTDQQVEDTAQLFLGIRIQCAKCHHHPFERWSQEDYYGFSAFFSRLGRKPGATGTRGEPRIFHNAGRASARNPRTGNELRPTGLGSGPMDVPDLRDPRLALAEWMSTPDNPYFARSLVNRYWKHFFGRGIVDPEDDMRVTNPPSHPELLSALAKHLVDSKFDLKSLVKAICQSTTYQLKSFPNDFNARDTQNYSRHYPKRLSAEVLYDAVHQMLGRPPAFGGMPANRRAVALPSSEIGNYFLTVFGKPMGDSACECERSDEANLAQTLLLMNSKELQDKLAHADGRAARLAKDTERGDEEKIDELYHWAFARPPVAEEKKTALDYLGKAADRQKAYEDVVWALINTKEFLFNH